MRLLLLPLGSGVHSVQVLYDDTTVPKSPFRVSVTEGCDPSRVVASGPGLEQALTNKPNNFNIVTRCRNKFISFNEVASGQWQQLRSHIQEVLDFTFK